MPPSHPLTEAFAELVGQQTASGGFRSPSTGEVRPDATSWAVLALKSGSRSREAIAAGRDYLAGLQLDDGRVPLREESPRAAWPTPLAMLAWHGSPSPEHQEAERRGLDFLLRSGGLALPPDPALGHDQTLVGWAWIEHTHSWVEPTAFGLMALTVLDLADHARAREAKALLLDRRLPRGGWNYGNTTVFGQELRPSPDSTGVALSGLAGHVDRDEVLGELSYLEQALAGLRSPLSLAWGLLGLSAFERRPADALQWIGESLSRQDRLGPYDTSLSSLLLLAATAEKGLLAAIREGSGRAGGGIR